MRTNRSAAVIALFILALPLSAQRLERGIAAHDRALAGDEAGLSEALALLGPEGWARPQLAFAYHGSAKTIEASFAYKAGKLAKALALIDEGAKEIDDALALDPKDLPTRILRLDNSVSLIESSPADRRPQAAEDLAFLRSAWSSLSAEDRALVELDSGRLAIADKKAGEAMAAWRRALREAPSSPSAARARKLLARYGD